LEANVIEYVNLIHCHSEGQNNSFMRASSNEYQRFIFLTPLPVFSISFTFTFQFLISKNRFMGMRSMSRDESMVEYMLKMLIQVLINFSLGLLMALVIFIFGLWSIIKSYQPNPLTAVAFFLSAACAAFAFVSTYLFLVYGAAAGGLYGTAKIIAANGGRIEGPGDRRRYQNVRNRPHYY